MSQWCLSNSSQRTKLEKKDYKNSKKWTALEHSFLAMTLLSKIDAKLQVGLALHRGSMSNRKCQTC